MTIFATDPFTDTVETITHPGWCDPTRCTVLPDLPLEDGLHLGTVVTIDAPVTTAGPTTIDVWLHQGATDDEPHLVLDAAGAGRAMFGVTGASAALDAVTDLLTRPSV
jgi:hypothetical protein